MLGVALAAATLAGCPLFPADFPTNQRVDSLPVAPNSDAVVRSIGLDEGMHATFDDLAKAERVSQSHVSRMLRLTLLSPDLIESILEGRQPESMRLEELMRGFSDEWATRRDIHVGRAPQASRAGGSPPSGSGLSRAGPLREVS